MKRVGIIRGGKGKNYRSSLKRGGEVIAHITENLGDKYKTIDILIDKEGVWHVSGRPILPADLVNKIDIAWNLATPEASIVLEHLSIPNVGNNSFSSALAESQEMLREHMRQIGVPMPRSIILPVYQADFDARPTEQSFGRGPIESYAIKKAKEVHEKFSPPWIVNPVVNVGDAPLVRGGATSPTSTNRVKSLAKTFNELVALIEECVNNGQSILVEEFIPGKVASVHSVPDFRGEGIYIFPVGNVFGNLSTEEKEQLIGLAKSLHGHLGARHYLKSNFLLNKRSKVYLLDFETTPNLKSFSHLAQACEMVGAKMQDVVEHMLEAASK